LEKKGKLRRVDFIKPKLRHLIDPTKIIVFDADVIIHFIKGDRLLDLFRIYPNHSIVLSKVYNELTKRASTKETIDNLISNNLLQKVEVPTNAEFIKEYAHLTGLRNLGEGESACLAYCRLSKDLVASSNLRDIKTYCEMHDITYLTTMDFIAKAYEIKFWSKQVCDNFVNDLTKNGARIPYPSFDEYLIKSKNR
jgi:predicted nucleic acid-binding protein